MKPTQLLPYALMAAGAALAAKAIPSRQNWEAANTHAAILLDWDDVQAVATRALAENPEAHDVSSLLRTYKENGATHLSLPELTLARLLTQGAVCVAQGLQPGRVYLQATTPDLRDLVVKELQVRLPKLEAKREIDNGLSFEGDLPTVAEVGLGFDPQHAGIAQQAGLALVARPVGYSWIQPAMIERTFTQAANLGAKIIAVQGSLIPGHEFNIQHTVEVMQRHQLTYAYFRESRHQKGDWFLAKHLAPAGLVMLAHEFELIELLDEDYFTAAYRWGNLAAEAGIRLCAVRFFRILHAADPLESVAYVHELTHALHRAGLMLTSDPPDLVQVQPPADKLALAGVGLSAAGAAGLAMNALPLTTEMKLVGQTVGAAVLASMPLIEALRANREAASHDHHHDHSHGHPHDDDHHHDHTHDHHHHHGPAPAPTAYAQKGLALAATVAYPAAVVSARQSPPAGALAQSALLSALGAVTVAATTTETDYLLGIEEYRGYNLDWLLPLGAVAGLNFLPDPEPDLKTRALRLFGVEQQPASTWSWLPLAGVGLGLFGTLAGWLPEDLPGRLDREHRHAHTHHLSKFQQKIGDLKLSLSARPLRKWSFLAPLGAVAATLFGRQKQEPVTMLALLAAVLGQVATLAGFRQGQRAFEKTLAGRAKAWGIGALLATALWAAARLLRKSLPR